MSAAGCGFGHRTLFTNIELELYQVIEKLITENGVDIFYTGGMGQFDEQFTNAVRKAKLKYNHIFIVLIKPYFSNELNTNKEYYNYRYDDVMICEESELVHPKAAIKKRNRWMVGASDDVYPDMFFGDTKLNATYMLCSDGFRHEITNEEIYNFLNPNVMVDADGMKHNMESLIELNKQRQERDNISVITIRTF